MKKFIYAFIFIIMMSSFVSCFKNTTYYNSIDELANEMVTFLEKGDAKAIDKIIMQKKQYVNEFYPHTPESRTMSGEDKFEIIMKVKRANAIMVKARLYKNRNLKLIKIGEPEKIIDLGEYQVFRKIPLTLEVDVESGRKTVVDSQLLGIVVKKDGKYQLLNVFR